MLPWLRFGSVVVLAAALVFLFSIHNDSQPTLERPSLAAQAWQQLVQRSTTQLRTLTKRQLHQHNQQSTQLSALDAEGWQITHAPEPNSKVLDLHLLRLDSNRAAYIRRIQTSPVSGPQLLALANIIRETTDPMIRTVGIEALGRTRDPAATDILVHLYATMDTNEDRRQIVSELIPHEVDSKVTQFLTDIVSNGEEPTEIRKIAAAKLAALALFQSAPGPFSQQDNWLHHFGPEGHSYFLEAIATLQSLPPNHTHQH